MIQIAPDKPFPPPGYEEERREMLNAALKRALLKFLNERLGRSKKILKDDLQKNKEVVK